MAESIRGLNIVIGSDTDGLNKALGEVDKSARSIQSELRQVEKLLKLDPKNTELVSQKQKLLGDAVATTKTRLDTLRKAQEQVNEQFAKGEISEAKYRAFQREIAATEQKLKSLETQAKNTALNLKKIGDSMTKTGAALTKAVTVPLAATGAAVAKVSIDFESAFAGVRKTVDGTEQQLSALQRGIRDMALDIPVAATEIASIGEAAGQLGIKTENILGFTRTMADLGVTTNMAAGDAATSLARLANITQMPQDQFDRLGSTIVALGNKLATTESEIVEMGLRIAGAGAQVGMTEDQILSFAGTLSSVGIAADAGGTAISKVMVNMASEVATGGEKLGMFAAVAGMTATEFAEAWRADAAEALATFISGLGRMSQAGENVFGVLQELGLSEVRVRDAMLRAAGAGDLLRTSLDLGAKAWSENTALTKEAEQRYETTAAKLQVLWNQVKEVGLTLGEGLVPAIGDAVEAAKPLIGAVADAARWFADLDEGTQKFILSVAGIAAVTGPALTWLGKGVLAYKAWTLHAAGAAAGTTAAGAAAAGATPFITGLGTAVNFLLGPWGLIVLGASALAIALGSIDWPAENAEQKIQRLDREASVAAGTLDGDLAPALGEVVAGMDAVTAAADRQSAAVERTAMQDEIYVRKQQKLFAELERDAVGAIKTPDPPTSAPGWGPGEKTWLDAVKSSLQLLSLDVAIVRGEYDLLSGSMDDGESEAYLLTKQLEAQQSELATHARKVDALTEALRRMRTEQGENSLEAKQLTKDLLDAQKAYQDLAKEIETTNEEIRKQRLYEEGKPWEAEGRGATDDEIKRWAAMSYIQRQMDAGAALDVAGIQQVLGVGGAPVTRDMLGTREQTVGDANAPGVVSQPVTITENVYIYGDADRHEVSKGMDDAHANIVQQLRLVRPGVIP